MRTKKEKALISLALGVTFTLVISFLVSINVLSIKAESSITSTEELSTTIEINGGELAAFAAKFDHVETLTGVEAMAHNAKVDDIILNNNLSDEMKRQYLLGLGVHEINTEKKTELAASSSGDVTLNKPTISYDSSTKQYIITATGRWKNHDYEVPNWSWWYPSVGSTKNIGGTEALGISFSNTSGPTSGLALNSGYGYFYNGSSTKKSTTLATENDNYGAGFKIQDFVKYTKVENYILWCNCSYLYNAYNMQCVLRYNRNFQNYSGNAKLFYSHTWDETSITSISVNDNGAGLGWSSKSDYWTGYSYARTFSKGKSTN